MNLFDSMETVDVTGGRLPTLGKGLHRVRINRVTVPKPNPLKAQSSFQIIVELKILRSSTEPTGADRKFWISSQYRDSFQAQFARFVFAALGFDPSNAEHALKVKPHLGAISNAAYSEANVLEGRELDIEGVGAEKDGEPVLSDKGKELIAQALKLEITGDHAAAAAKREEALAFQYTNYRFAKADDVAPADPAAVVPSKTTTAAPAPATAKPTAPKRAKTPAQPKIDPAWDVDEESNCAYDPGARAWRDRETGAIVT